MKRDINRSIEFVEMIATRGLKKREPRSIKPPRTHYWRAPVNPNEPTAKSVFRLKPKLTLNARYLKIAIPLSVAEVAALPVVQRVDLAIKCEGVSYSTNVAGKALRKVQSSIRENGAEKVFVEIQGKLKGNEIIECGITAHAKGAKG